MAGKYSTIFYLCFFLSGLTSLVYESLWIRSFAIAFGSTTFSLSLVVALFLLGLALGAFAGGQICKSLRHPILLYGLLEAFIGISALLLAYAIPAWPELLSFLGGAQWSDSTWMVLKILSVIFLLTPPTLAMGMTFPLLVQFFENQRSSTTNHVARLYSINTFGAVAGASAAGFLFIPWLGTLYTNHLMVLLNFALFMVAVKVGEPSPMGAPQVPRSPAPRLNSDRIFYLFSAFVVGGAAIGAEVAWNKYLSIFFGSNIFSVSLILSLFLLGVALGAFAFSKVPTSFSRPRLFLWLFTFAILSTLFASSLLGQVPIWSQAFTAFSPLLGKAIVVFILLFPATFCFGALLPLTIHLVSENSSNSAAWAGSVYAWNTMGGLLGSLIVGLAMIPHLGTGATLWWLCALLGSTFFIFVVLQVVRNRHTWIGPLLFAVVGWILIHQPTSDFINLIQSAEFSYSTPHATPEDTKAFLARVQGNIRFMAEGENAVISLHYQTDDKGDINPSQLILKSNGLAESFFDLQNPGVVPRYEGLLALLPYLYLNNPQKAFVVGFGGGYTAEVLSSLGLEEVLVSEIEKEILQASESAYLGSNPLLDRNNLEVKIEDARFLLTRSPDQSFDVITSQPSHSWISGVSHLFTQNFFQIVHKKLKSGGVFTQWLNLYNMDSVTLKSLIQTFFSVFEYGAIYTHNGDDQLVFVGSSSPLTLQYKKLKALTKDRYWRERMIHIPLHNEWDFLSNFSMDRSKALALAAGAALNTDRNPYSEIRQSRLFYQSESQESSMDNFLGRHFYISPDQSKQLWKSRLEAGKSF